MFYFCIFSKKKLELQARLAPGKQSGEHSYPYFDIFITMRGSHIMRVSVILTRSFLHAGKCPMRGSVTSYYHAGKCRAGKVHAGNLHAGKYHRTVMSCMQRFQDTLAYFATAISY